MMNNVRIRKFVSLFCILFSFVASAYITGVDSSKAIPGTWSDKIGSSTGDSNSARWYAKKNSLFYIVVCEMSGGCTYSSTGADKIWNTADFKKWSKECGVPIVVASYPGSSLALTDFFKYYAPSGTSTPAMAVVDGDDGISAFGVDVIHTSSVMVGTGDTKGSVGGAGVYFSSLTSQTPAVILDYYLNRSDDTPVAMVADDALGRKFYGTRPHAISSSTTLVNGLWKSWTVGGELVANTLSSIVFHPASSTKTVMAQADDRQDWYTFDCSSDTKKQEQSYIVTCPTLSGKCSLGYLGVYITEAKAKQAAKSFENAKKYASNWISMSDLTTANGGRGRDFTIPKGTAKVYLCFCRRAANSNEGITIKYTFTLKQGKLDAFEFGNAAESFDEYDKMKVSATTGSFVTNDCCLTVCRDTAGSKTTASITLEDGTATYGTDYVVDGATYTAKAKTASVAVSFGTSDKTAKLPFKVISKHGVWTGDRTFTATIAKDQKSGSKKTAETVTISEVDDDRDSDDPTNDEISGATELPLAGATITNRLNGVLTDKYDDQRDWFKITGRQADKVAWLTFTNLYKNAAADQYKLKVVYGDQGTIIYKETNVTDHFSAALPPNLFTKDVYFCVEKENAANAYHCNIYELSVGQVDQPVAEFGASVKSAYVFDSPDEKYGPAPSNVSFVVTLNKQESSPYYKTWENYLPRWRTVDGTGKNEIDFVGTPNSGKDVTLSGDAVTADWSLKSRKGFVPGCRSFTVELLPDSEGYYRLGTNSSVTVTIKGDDDGKLAERYVAPEMPVARQFTGSEPSSVETAGHNLSYTNIVDDIYFTDIKAQRPYVLGAEIAQLKNPNNTPITVSVWTNGYDISKTYRHVHPTNFVALVTNDLGIATNCYDALVEVLGENEAFAAYKGVGKDCFYAKIETNVTVWSENGKLFPKSEWDVVVTTNAAKCATNKRTTTQIRYYTNVSTNDYRSYLWEIAKFGPNEDGSFDLEWLTCEANMPRLTFARNGAIKVQVSRPEDQDVLVRCTIKMTQWLMDEDIREGQELEGEATSSVTFAGLKSSDSYELNALVAEATPPSAVVNCTVSTNGVTMTDGSGKVWVWTIDDLPVITGATNVEVSSWIAYTNQEFNLGPYSPVTEANVVIPLGTNDTGVATNCLAAVTNYLVLAHGADCSWWSLADFPASVTNELGVATNCFDITVTSNITAFIEYGQFQSNLVTHVCARTGKVVDAKGRTSTSATYYTIWSTNEWARVPAGSGDEVPYQGDVSATYSMGLSGWAQPEVKFTESAWSYAQTNATMTLDFARNGGWQLPTTVFATTSTNGLGGVVWAARPSIDFTTLKDEPFSIALGATNGAIAVENLLAPAATNIWVGDRALKVSFSVSDAKYAAVVPTTATVTMKSVVPEYEEGDTSDETTNNPLVKDTAVTSRRNYDRTLNGEDTKDCFWINDVVAGTTYRFRLEYRAGTTDNLEGTGFKFVRFIYDNDAVTNTLEKAAGVLCQNYDITPSKDGTIKIRIDRSGTSTAERPISLGYTLMVREWPWPTFAFASERLAAKNGGDETNVTFTIKRTENCEGTNWVEVTLKPMTNNAVSATSPEIGTTKRFTFLPGQSETNWQVSVVSPALTPSGVWTGDWAFQADLAVETDEKKDKVRLGDITNCVVVVADVVAERDWHDAYHDDDWNTLDDEATTNIWPEVQTLSGCRLNGGDANDWFRFSNIASNTTYAFTLDVDGTKTNHLDGAGVMMAFYQVTEDGEDLVALEQMSAGVVRSIGDEDILVHVYRNASAVGVSVSAAYSLRYCSVSAMAYIESTGALSVNGNAGHLDVWVVCTNITGDATLSVPVMATFYAENQPGDWAQSPDDYRSLTNELCWAAGSTGGRVKVRVPITNYDTTWEGDQTFHVRLAVDREGADGVHLPDQGMSTNVCVTIVETNPPQYGTVAITHAGEPLVSVKNAATTVWPAREGDSVNLALKRRGGVTGQVVLKWYWKDSTKTTVKFANGSSYFYTTNFLSGEKGYGQKYLSGEKGPEPNCSVPVPVKAGSLISENWTLGYRIDTTRGVAATVYTGSPTALTFAVAGQYYGGAIADYSAGNKAKVVFAAADAAWFKGRSDGVVRSSTPDAAGSVAMTAKVKGPGTLKFGVTFTDVVSGYLTVSGGDTSVKIKADGVYAVHVSAGTKTLTFTFKRSSKDGANAAVAIAGVMFVPDAAFNGYGTFTGPVTVDGVAGLATLTVASSGKTSGKFQCADRTWTFSTNGAWNAANALAVTAKSGKLSKSVVFGLDAASGAVTNAADGAVVLELGRKVWSDKPVDATRVTKLNDFVGTYAADVTNAYAACCGTLAIRIAAGGTVVVAGTLADGTTVSASVPLVFTTEGIPWAYAFTAPAAYKAGWFAMPFGFVNDSGTFRAGRLATKPVTLDDLNWKSNAKGDTFEESAGLDGVRK